MTHSNQQHAETALNTPQMDAEASASDTVAELRRLQAQIERFRHTGDQSPEVLLRRNEVESRYNQLWVRLRDQGRT